MFYIFVINSPILQILHRVCACLKSEMIFFLIYANSFKGYDDHEESQSNRNETNSFFVRNCFRSMEIANSSSEDDDKYDAFTEATKKAFFEIDYYKEKRIYVDIDLLEYWNSTKFIFPWLRKLAFVVHSVPATQVSVERSISALRLILGDLRYNLSEEN